MRRHLKAEPEAVFARAQRKRLAQVASRCPVHKTLANGVHVVDTVTFDDGG